MSRSATAYKQFTHLEHILARPDTYVGSVTPDTTKQWIVDDQRPERMKEQEVTYVAALFKIFDEILVNAVDHSKTTWDDRVDSISVRVEGNTITVCNTGAGIPIEIHPDTHLYVPEMIFGELLTSSNYDDSEQRVTGGRNGYGAKLTNIFSSWFEVDIGNVDVKKRYVQSWTHNMSQKHKPRLTSYSKKKGYTQIAFTPDLARFHLTSLQHDDILKMLERRTYDVCACTAPHVKVLFNGQLLQYKSFETYVDLFLGCKRDTERLYLQSSHWEVVVATSNHGFKQVSFVNGISTSRGGSHVDYIVQGLLKKVLELTKAKDTQVKTQHFKEHLFVFIQCTCVNPSFSSQTKTECTSRYRDFVPFTAWEDPVIMKKVMKMQFVQEALALAKHKQQRELGRSDGRKISTLRGIPKLEDANKAGTAHSKDCTLILTEGDSAKTFAISGLSVVGRDRYGVFPLKGKLLNVRDASPKQLLNNEEMNNIKKILGLQNGKQYQNVHDLRYGRVMILTDADVDGAHIKGLFLNFIHVFWPSLIPMHFVTSMRTPIMKATKGRDVRSFFSKHEYDAFAQQVNLKQWAVKYYKGLGTSTSAEAKEYFQQLPQTLLTYTNTASSHDASMALAFQKQLSNDRKQWIRDGTLKQETLDADTRQVHLTDFVNKELIWFSIADNERSLPCVVDGFKPSQRKVLFACRARSNTEIKVSQLSGHVSSATAYHHGEQSLMGTIVNMAQDFVGANNTPLLQACGQFGTRLMGGKDAASPRYIFTRLHACVETLFDKRDDPVLEYLCDDGVQVEPRFYVPALPLLLLNGSEGIGTGYSTSIPCFHPRAVLDNVLACIHDQPMTPMRPWYQHFQGDITELEPGKFVSRGRFTRGPQPHVIRITELPIGKWTSDYKDFLESLECIKKVENHSTETEVHFVLHVHESFDHDATEKTLRLTSLLNTSNMHAFDEHGVITKYDSPLDIIRAFVRVKLAYMHRRKEHLLRTWSDQFQKTHLQLKFVQLVVQEQIHIFRQPMATIREQLHTHQFPTTIHDTLIHLPLSSFTMEQVHKLEQSIQDLSTQMTELQATSLSQLWTHDLRKIKTPP